MGALAHEDGSIWNHDRDSACDRRLRASPKGENRIEFRVGVAIMIVVSDTSPICYLQFPIFFPPLEGGIEGGN